MAAPVTPNKGKNRADDLSNIHAAIALERDWEPGSDGAETAHHEWVELMTLHLTELSRAGASEAEVDQLVDEIFAAHSEQLQSLFGQWPAWASPIMTGAHERAVAATAAQQAQEEEDRRQARIVELRTCRPHASVAPSATNVDTAPAVPPPTGTAPVALSSNTQGSELATVPATRKRRTSGVAVGDQPAKKLKKAVVRKADGPTTEKKPTGGGRAVAVVRGPGLQCERCLSMSLPSCEVLSRGTRCGKCSKDHKECAKNGELFRTWYRRVHGGAAEPDDATEDDANERDTATPGAVQQPAALPPPLSQTSRGRPVVDLSFGSIGGSTTAPPGMFSFAPPQAPSTPGAIGGPPSLFRRIVAPRVSGLLNRSRAPYDFGTNHLRDMGVLVEDRRQIHASVAELEFTYARLDVLEHQARNLERLIDEQLEPFMSGATVGDDDEEDEEADGASTSWVLGDTANRELEGDAQAPPPVPAGPSRDQTPHDSQPALAATTSAPATSPSVAKAPCKPAGRSSLVVVVPPRRDNRGEGPSSRPISNMGTTGTGTGDGDGEEMGNDSSPKKPKKKKADKKGDKKKRGD